MTLHLSHLTLSHFRSHPRVQAEFDGRPVAFFGHNGAGKTNLLEAISLLSPGRGLRRAAADDLIGKPARLGWKIDAELMRNGTPHEITTQARPDSPRSVRIDGKLTPQAALGRLAAVLWLTPAMDRLWTEAAEGRRRFLDRLVLGFHPDHAETTLAYEKAMRERNRLLRDDVRDPHWYGALESRMGEMGAAITTNRHATIARLAAVRDTSGSFPSATLTLLDDSPAESRALTDALSSNRGRDLAAGRSLIGPHRADLGAFWEAREMPAAQCSTGEQKAMLISLVLAHAQALQADTGRAPLLLLDEVAAHLDENRRAALYDQLCDLRVQAFLTGTGPELFTPLGDRAQMFEIAQSGAASVIREESRKD